MELFEIELFLYLTVCKKWCLTELLVLNSNTWKYITVC